MQKYTKILFTSILLIIGLFFLISAQPTFAASATCCTCKEAGGDEFESFACIEGRHSCDDVCRTANTDWREFTDALSASEHDTHAYGERVTCCECQPMAGAGYRYHCQTGDSVCEQELGGGAGWVGLCKPHSLGTLTETGRWGKWLVNDVTGPNVTGATEETPPEETPPAETEETKDLAIQLSSALGGTVSGLPQFIERIYNWLIAIAGGVATVMIMIGGFIYLTAMGNPTQIGKAKEMISNAVIGLFLALGAFLILNTVNPAILNLKMPGIKKITGKPIGFKTASCPTNSNVISIADQTEARNRCASDCRGADQIVIFDQAPTSLVPSGGWCCGCLEDAIERCPRNPEWTTVPTEFSASPGITTEITDSAGWCNELCTIVGSFRNFRVDEGEPDCCECLNPLSEATTPESERAGSTRECLIEREPTEPTCERHSGTDGTCTYESGGGGIPRQCEWEHRTCTSDEDCVEAGSVHCWGGYCYQEKLPNGEICEYGGDLVCIGDCEEEWGWNYCVNEGETCDRCIPDHGICGADSDCESEGARCAIGSGGVDISRCFPAP